MLILGIETSCDETSAAVLEVKGDRFCVLSNVVASQIKIHAKYGGVVPEVAARSHVVRIFPIIKKAINLKSKIINHKSIDLIAVTAGPGLISALSVGLETARYLGYAWGVPVVATNHLAGHLYSSLLTSSLNPLSLPLCKGENVGVLGEGEVKKEIAFPALGLIVSGGHTELVFMKGHGQYKLIGETLDDAAGEAFDKIAKLLGLPYPGGPELARLAEKGDSHAYEFPRPMIHNTDFSAKGGSAYGGNFSFSGLKTSVLYFLKAQTSPQPSPKRRGRKDNPLLAGEGEGEVADICASVQAAIVDVLVAKTVSAAKKYRVKTVLLGGGVAANKSLRQKLKMALKKQIPNSSFLIPNSRYCTDNAAMIAAAGYITYKRRGATPLDHLSVDPHLALA